MANPFIGEPGLENAAHHAQSTSLDAQLLISSLPHTPMLMTHWKASEKW